MLNLQCGCTAHVVPFHLVPFVILHPSVNKKRSPEKDLTDWVKEQLDDLAKEEREEKAEQRKYDKEQKKYAGEQRQLEDAREEKKRQHELALKEKELKLEKAKKENAEALANQQTVNPNLLR
ncbi:uncharacterized protein [Macrobrachium rosenbergii]|uniref:uncharacterized protein n=1 Tax=Macrobrachium rosenbergii TaxID=79674 RepID=UPI0034D4F0E9